MDTNLINKRDVAKRINSSEQTVARLVNDGKLPVIRVGNRLKFQVSDIDAYIEANRNAAVKPKESN